MASYSPSTGSAAAWHSELARPLLPFIEEILCPLLGLNTSPCLTWLFLPFHLGWERVPTARGGGVHANGDSVTHTFAIHRGFHLNFFLSSPSSLPFIIPCPLKLLAWVLGHLEVHWEQLGLLEKIGVLECFASMCISVEKIDLMFWQVLKGIPATKVCWCWLSFLTLSQAPVLTVELWFHCYEKMSFLPL